MNILGFLIIATLMLLIDAYVYQGILVLSEGAPAAIRKIWHLSFWVLSILLLGLVFYLLLNRGRLDENNVFIFLRSFVFILYASKVFFLLFLGLDDLRRGLVYALQSLQLISFEGSFQRSLWWTRVALLAGLVPFLSLIYGMIRNPYRYQLRQINIQTDKLPKGFSFKIVQLSDIHAGSLKNAEAIQKAVDQINELQADLILFTGDLVNNTAAEITPFQSIFGGLNASYGVYSVLGNHDYGDYVRWPSREAKLANMKALKQAQKDMGWHLLLNEHKLIKIDQQTIQLLGVENYSALPQFPKYGKLDIAAEGLGLDNYTILLSHDPTHWDSEVLQKYPGVDLTLSGHTHGFQFGIEWSGVIKWSPSQYIYNRWAGLYQEGSQYLYVNRGFGFLGYPGRVGILPEITIIEIQGQGRIPH